MANLSTLEALRFRGFRQGDERHERLMRDYLLADSDAVAAYAALKIELARYAEDSLAYTKATVFVQKLVDKARTERGLSPVNVWND